MREPQLTGATAGLLVGGFFVGALASTVIGGALTERWARADRSVRIGRPGRAG